MPTLTKKQKEIFDFINSYHEKHGVSPTIEEMGARFKRAVGTIHEHVEELVKKGFIKKISNSVRGIELNKVAEMVRIPLAGTIAAGQPIEAVQERETVAISKNSLPKSGDFFALRVAGDSMVQENINDGDLVLIKKQNFANNGDRVVALIDNSEATLKKFYKEKNNIRLQPANKNYNPIIVKQNSLEIQGVVIDVIRNYVQKNDDMEKPLKEKTSDQQYIEDNQIVCGDTVQLLDRIKPNSVDLVLSDIPYGIALDDWDVLHANTNSALLGSSPAQAGKNAFKRRGKPINGWSSADRSIPKEYQDWCYSWSKKLFPTVKEGGSVFIFGARRTIHRAIIALEESGFLLRDILAWEKPAAHHRAQGISDIMRKRGLEDEANEWEGWKVGNLAPKYEPIAWLFKPYKLTITDNVLKNGLGAMNIGESLIDGKSPSNILKFGFDPKEGGLHEAQKPLGVLKYLINLVTKKDQLVLDPFVGSGSTAVAAKLLGRKYVGFEKSKEYCELSKKRLDNTSKLNNQTKSRAGNSQTRLF